MKRKSFISHYILKSFENNPRFDIDSALNEADIAYEKIKILCDPVPVDDFPENPADIENDYILSLRETIRGIIVPAAYPLLISPKTIDSLVADIIGLNNKHGLIK